MKVRFDPAQPIERKPRPYVRRREFVIHSEGDDPDQLVCINCLYATLVTMIRLQDPFQDADNRKNPFLLD